MESNEIFGEDGNLLNVSDIAHSDFSKLNPEDRRSPESLLIEVEILREEMDRKNQLLENIVNKRLNENPAIIQLTKDNLNKSKQLESLRRRFSDLKIHFKKLEKVNELLTEENEILREGKDVNRERIETNVEKKRKPSPILDEMIEVEKKHEIIDLKITSLFEKKVNDVISYHKNVQLEMEKLLEETHSSSLKAEKKRLFKNLSERHFRVINLLKLNYIDFLQNSGILFTTSKNEREGASMKLLNDFTESIDRLSHIFSKYVVLFMKEERNRSLLTIRSKYSKIRENLEKIYSEEIHLSSSGQGDGLLRKINPKAIEIDTLRMNIEKWKQIIYSSHNKKRSNNNNDKHGTIETISQKKISHVHKRMKQIYYNEIIRKYYNSSTSPSSSHYINNVKVIIPKLFQKLYETQQEFNDFLVRIRRNEVKSLQLFSQQNYLVHKKLRKRNRELEEILKNVSYYTTKNTNNNYNIKKQKQMMMIDEDEDEESFSSLLKDMKVMIREIRKSVEHDDFHVKLRKAFYDPQQQQQQQVEQKEIRKGIEKIKGRVDKKRKIKMTSQLSQKSQQDDRMYEEDEEDKEFYRNLLVVERRKQEKRQQKEEEQNINNNKSKHKKMKKKKKRCEEIEFEKEFHEILSLGRKKMRSREERIKNGAEVLDRLVGNIRMRMDGNSSSESKIDEVLPNIVRLQKMCNQFVHIV